MTSPKTGGTYQLGAGLPAAETRANADTTALKANNISVTQLDGDWTLPGADDLIGELDGTARHRDRDLADGQGHAGARPQASLRHRRLRPGRRR